MLKHIDDDRASQQGNSDQHTSEKYQEHLDSHDKESIAAGRWRGVPPLGRSRKERDLTATKRPRRAAPAFISHSVTLLLVEEPKRRVPYSPSAVAERVARDAVGGAVVTAVSACQALGAGQHYTIVLQHLHRRRAYYHHSEPQRCKIPNMAATKQVRRSVTIPSQVDRQIEAIAKKRRLSGSRVLVELVEMGLAARKQKEKAFFELAERFRRSDDPEQIKQLGDELGRFVFGE